jgi:hypothetical protein
MRLSKETLKTRIRYESDRQIVWHVSSQSPVVGLRREVHYWAVWVYAEARTVMRAVVKVSPLTVGV